MVTLIVKAPNHPADQMVSCELTWTIKRLKSHLSSIFPCQPEEQKLIYSGQLLQDAVVLKDVLRLFDDGQDQAHTVHLVYTPKQSIENTNAKMDQGPQSQSGLRRRNVQPTALAQSGDNSITPASAPPGIASQLYSQPTSYISSLPTAMPESASNLAIYQQWYQHHYIQYVNQYMAYVASLQQQPQLSPVTQPTTQGASDAALPEDQPQAVPQQRFPLLVHDEPDRVERDWLDYVNSICRIVFMLLMIYFYSSALRFMIVMCAVFALFLYRNRRTLFGMHQHVDAVAPAAPPAQLPVPPEQEPNNANPDNNNNDVVVNRNAADTEPPEQNNPTTVLSFLRTFVSSFFSSLLPEPALAP